MYIKLNFTQNKTCEQVFRILTDIINNAGTVTSISALTTRFTSVGAAGDLLTGFDSANSELIVTSPINTSLTRAHICRSLAVADSFQFTLEQSVYDSTSTKYYTRIYADRGAGAVGTTNTIPYTSHGASGAFVCSATTLAVGDRVTVTGTYGGTGTWTGYLSGNTYVVSSVTGTSPSVTGFSLVDASILGALTTTAGTATGLTFTAQSPVQITVGDTSTTPAFDPALSMAITVASRGATASGTALTVQNAYSPSIASYVLYEYMTMQNTCVKTFWCYITDKTFLIGFNGMTSTSLGWSTTVSTNQAYISSNIFVSQYTRLDHWNTSSNSVVPVIWTKPRPNTVSLSHTGGAGLFTSTADYNILHLPYNTAANATSIVPTLLLNSYNTAPSNTSSYLTKLYNQFVAYGAGLKSTGHQILQNSAVVADTGATATSGLSSCSVNFSGSGSGMPNSTLTSRTYHLHPITWANEYIGAYGGGNISEQSGFYIYNGDYQAGDEFTYNSVTYSIWPSAGALPSSSRLGIAVPKV